MRQHIVGFINLDNHVKEVIKGSSAAFTLRLVGMGLAYVFNIVLARTLSTDGVGIYYLAFSIVMIAQVVGRIGFDNAVLRFTAMAAATNAWSDLAGLYRKSVTIAALASTIVSLLTIGFAPLMAQQLFQKPDLTIPLQLMALGIVPWCLMFLHGEFLRGLKRIRDTVFLQNVGIALIGLPLIALLAVHWGTQGAALSYTLAATALLVLGIFMWKRAAPQLRGVQGEFSSEQLFRVSIPLFWIMLINTLISATDMMFLGIWVDSDAIGIYGVAKRIAVLTGFSLTAINSIIAPKFAALHANGSYAELHQLARNGAFLTMLVSTPILLLCVGIPGLLLSLFGSEFTAGSNILRILVIGQFVNAITGSVGYLLMMSGHEKAMRNNMIASLVVQIPLALVLIPNYGAIGAAIAVTVSAVQLNLTSTYLVYRKLSFIVVPVPKRLFTHVR